MIYEVYKIQNKINKKIYIGITNQGWNKRCSKHKSDARNGCDFKLHRAIRKYGVDKFNFNLLEECNSSEELKIRESYWIETLKTMDDSFGYNMTKGGDGTFGKLHSEESKQKMSEMALNNDSYLHNKVEIFNINTLEIKIFKTIRNLSLFLDVSENNLAIKLAKNESISVMIGNEEWLCRRRDDLKSKPKPKLTERNPEQVKEHMLNMQLKSSEARKEDDTWKEKIKKSKLDNGTTKIVQQFKDGILIAEYEGSRDAVLKNEDFHRSGLQHVLKGRKNTYKGYTWKFKENLIPLN